MSEKTEMAKCLEGLREKAVTAFPYSERLTLDKTVIILCSFVSPEETRLISGSKILRWLWNYGYIGLSSPSDFETEYEYAPTQKGYEAGISFEERYSNTFGKTSRCVLSKKAQRIVVENLAEILEQRT